MGIGKTNIIGNQLIQIILMNYILIFELLLLNLKLILQIFYFLFIIKALNIDLFGRNFQ